MSCCSLVQASCHSLLRGSAKCYNILQEWINMHTVFGHFNDNCRENQLLFTKIDQNCLSREVDKSISQISDWVILKICDNRYICENIDIFTDGSISVKISIFSYILIFLSNIKYQLDMSCTCFIGLPVQKNFSKKLKILLCIYESSQQKSNCRIWKGVACLWSDWGKEHSENK